VVAALAVVAVVAVAFLRAPAGPAPRLTLPRAGDDAAAGGPAPPPADGAAAGAGAGGGGTASSTGTPATLTVHAAGAVASPGVYTVAAGARVADVVTAAGGPLPEADVDRLNLAARVADGDRVFVPRRGDPATSGSGSDAGGSSGGAGGGVAATTTPAGPLDLNAATPEQLDTLPGVGPATARAIVTYRTRHGRFRSVTELLDVPGIGPAKLEAIRPLVKV
jgi:competence protein ComEA